MKRKKIIVGLFAATVLANSLTGCGKEASMYENGIEALEKADYKLALDCFNKAESEESDLKKVYRADGLATLSLGEYARAEDYFIRALGKSNGIIENMDIDISYYLAVTFYKEGKLVDAMKTLDSIIDIRPSSDKAYYLRGKLKLLQGDIAGAIDDYNKTVEISPGDYDHYIRIYEDLQASGYTAESAEYIAKAKNLGNKLNDYKKGILEYYEGNYIEARNHLEAAMKSKKDPKLLIYLGRTYEAIDDYSYAASLYEEALNTDPNSGILYNQLAGVKIKQKDYAGALKVIEEALSNSDGEAVQELMHNRVIVCEYVHDFEKASAYMQEYLERFPDDKMAQREYIFLKSR